MQRNKSNKITLLSRLEITMNSFTPSPQLAYATIEQANAAIDDHASQQGYVVVIKHKRKIGNKADGEVNALVLAL